MPASFDFLRYEIDEIKYNKAGNPEFEKNRNTKLEVSLQRNNEDQTLFRLCLKLDVQVDRLVSLVMHGYFKWQLEYIPEETEKTLISYGTSILFPYARHAISAVSILDGGNPIQLQTINPFEQVPSQYDITKPPNQNNEENNS